MPATLSKDEEAMEEARKEKIIRNLSLNMFLSVTVLTTPLQGEIELFTKVLYPGDAIKAATAITTTSSLAGLVEFLFNPTLGRLSDRVGRKPFFLFAPLVAAVSAGMIALKGTSNVHVAIAFSVLRKVMSTWGGSVATMTILGDLMNGKEYAIAFARVFGSAGWGVILGPLLGSIIFKRTGSVKVVYAAASVIAVMQSLNNNLMIPETLTAANAKAFMGMVNPFSFVKLFSYDANFTKMVMAAVFPSFAEGKNINDIKLLWGTNEAGFPSDTIGKFVSCWGVCCLFNGMVLTPQGIKALGMRSHMSLTNFTNSVSYLLESLLPRLSASVQLPALYLSLAFLAPGINGTNGSAAKGWATTYALKRGMGSGEYAGYFSNARALTTILSPLIYGRMYQALKTRGINPAPIWLVAFLLASLAPELLWRSIPAAEMPDAPEVQKQEDSKAKA